MTQSNLHKLRMARAVQRIARCGQAKTPEPGQSVSTLVPAASVSVNKEYYTTKEAAALLGKCVGTLKHWRSKGEGPPYKRYSRMVYYPIAPFNAWRRENLGVEGHDPATKAASAA